MHMLETQQNGESLAKIIGEREKFVGVPGMFGNKGNNQRQKAFAFGYAQGSVHVVHKIFVAVWWKKAPTGGGEVMT